MFQIPMLQLKLQPSLGGRDKNFTKSTMIYIVQYYLFGDDLMSLVCKENK